MSSAQSVPLAESSFHSVLASLLPKRTPPAIARPLQRALGIDRLTGLYEDLSASHDGRPLPARLLEKLEVRWRASETDLLRIPREGPLIVVANHPFGLLDAAVVASLLSEIRSDVRFLGNYLLGSIPELRDHLIVVDPFAKAGASPRNVAALREALRTLDRGGAVAMFPAGEVAHLRLSQRDVSDARWNSSAGWLARRSDAPVLPVFVEGSNGPLFQAAGLVHPLLRTALLPRELLNKRGRQVRIRIGTPIGPEKSAQLASDQERADYYRGRTFFLAHRPEFSAQTSKSATRLLPPRRVQRPTARAIAPELLAKDVESLPADRRLAELGGMVCCWGYARELPAVLKEIGRLREISFRAVGEGTGRQTDLDSFDATYKHLFVWNAETSEVVGAYRLAETDLILSQHGRRGLYTAALFRYPDELLERMGPAIELGRSFIRPEYQTGFAPLLLLWKAIGKYVSERPEYKILFGPVSISGSYPTICRQLMVRYLTKRSLQSDWARLVRPRRAFQASQDVCSGVDVDDLCSMVGEIDSERPGLPVLLRHYLGLGGKLLGFSVDKDFGDALDGLIVVDLTQTEPKLLARYLGKKEAARFLAAHQR